MDVFIPRACILHNYDCRSSRRGANIGLEFLNAKCLYPKKISLTESGKDISVLSSFFEHTNTILLLLIVLEPYGSI